MNGNTKTRDALILALARQMYQNQGFTGDISRNDLKNEVISAITEGAAAEGVDLGALYLQVVLPVEVEHAIDRLFYDEKKLVGDKYHFVPKL